MQIKYLSSAEQASFSEMIHSGSELSEMFGAMILMLQADTDYDELMIAFEDEEIVRVTIEDSPYTIILDAQDQIITIQQEHVGGGLVYETYDFDDDGLETAVDVIASRILGEEEYGY